MIEIAKLSYPDARIDGYRKLLTSWASPDPSVCGLPSEDAPIDVLDDVISYR
jgi:hypothetical protein